MPFDFGKMKSVRLKLALSMEDAAKKAGFSGRQDWYGYESGRRVPTLATLDRIASALQIDPRELIRVESKR